MPPCPGTGVPRQPGPQEAKARRHQGASQKASQRTGLQAGAAMWAAKSGEQRGCHPLPLPASQSWHRCAGGQGSAPGLAGWSCPHEPRRSRTAALGASSQLSSPPGSAGKATWGEHSPTRTSAPTQGVGWGTCPVRDATPPSHASVATPQHGKAAATLQTSQPFPEDQTATFSSLFCICSMFMLMAFTALQGGKPHPWFSRCTMCCPASPTAAQPQRPPNLQHGTDKPPVCSKAANPILLQQYRKQLAHHTTPSPGQAGRCGTRRQGSRLPIHQRKHGLVTGEVKRVSRKLRVNRGSESAFVP